MKGLRRWLFNFEALVSLLLGIATLGLWVRSYWVCDVLYQSRYYVGPAMVKDSGWSLRLEAGSISITHEWQDIPAQPSTVWPAPEFGWEQFSPTYPTTTITSIWNRLGMESHYSSSRTGGAGRMVTNESITLPFWLPFLMTLVGPGLWLLPRVRRQLTIPGRCLKCGYDLRATPDRCPECGTVPAPAKEAGI